MATYPVDDSLYSILQVSPGARTEVIQAAYRVLARIYHPDVSLAPDADEQTRRINAAYDVLGDPVRRASYDALRADAGRSAAGRNSPPGPRHAARSSAGERLRVADRPTGSMVFSWVVTSCVALAIVVAMLLALWALFDASDSPSRSTRGPRDGVERTLRAPLTPPFGTTTGSWSR